MRVRLSGDHPGDHACLQPGNVSEGANGAAFGVDGGNFFLVEAFMSHVLGNGWEKTRAARPKSLQQAWTESIFILYHLSLQLNSHVPAPSLCLPEPRVVSSASLCQTLAWGSQKTSLGRYLRHLSKLTRARRGGTAAPAWGCTSSSSSSRHMMVGLVCVVISSKYWYALSNSLSRTYFLSIGPITAIYNCFSALITVYHTYFGHRILTSR